VGVGGLGVASAACAVAPTVDALIAGRGLQGVFAALLTPASLAVIIATFGPDERGKAIGTWAAFSGIASVVGPLVGGWLVDNPGWRWSFAVNLPFIAVAIVLAARMPAAAPSRRGRRPDWLGAMLCARSNFAWGNLETFFVYGALGAFFFVLVVFLQQAAGYSAVEAGAATIPTTVVLLLFSRGSVRSPTCSGRGGSWPSARWCRPPASCACSRASTSRRACSSTSSRGRRSSRSGSPSSRR
jgi:MFS family permease